MTFAVYKHYDADGQCLYIGITSRPTQRMYEHKCRTEWAGRVARTELERFATRSLAAEAERIAIKATKPPGNSIRLPVAAYSYVSRLSHFIKTRPEKSMADWAEQFGISRPYLYGLVDGTRTPSPEVAMQIERETSGAVPAASWPNIAAMLTAADAIRGANQ